MIRNEKININYFASFLVLLFFILVPLGIYYHIQNVIVIIFGFIGILLLFLDRATNYHINFKNNIIFFLWILYIIVSILSTIIYKRFNYNDMSGIYTEISFTLIIYILTKNWDIIYFLKIFRNFIIILGFIAIISEITRIDPFSVIKRGTQFVSIDPNSNGGISTIFEFRHYYGLFVISALISLWEFPLKKFVLNFLCNIILLLNLILTSTRDAWLAFLIVLILWLIKEKPLKISLNGIICFFIIIIGLTFLIFAFPDILHSFVQIISSRLTQITASQDTYGGIGGVRGYTLQYGTKYILDNWNKYLLIGGGNGFALEWLWYNPFGLVTKWTNAIDVQYVTTFMNTGIIGLFSLVLIFLIDIKDFIISNTHEGKAVSLILICMGIMMSFFDVIPFNSSPFAFWIICVCALDTLGLKKENED